MPTPNLRISPGRRVGGQATATHFADGNADLYILVDPCNDDEVEYVSVGSTRLVVIDRVTCPAIE